MPRLMTVTLTITIAPEEATHAAPGAEAAPAPSATHADVDQAAPRRMPWEHPVAPDVAACTLCDRHGFVDLVDATGTPVVLTCGHDPAHLRAFVEAQGYQLVREDRSREPPPAQEGGET